MKMYKYSVTAITFCLVLASCGSDNSGDTNNGGGTANKEISAAFGSLEVTGQDAVFGTGRTFSPSGGRVDSFAGATNYLLHNQPEGYPQVFTANYDHYSVSFMIFDGNLGSVYFSYFNSGNDPLMAPDSYSYELVCDSPTACDGVNFSGSSAQLIDVDMPVYTGSTLPNAANSIASLNGTISW